MRGPAGLPTLRRPLGVYATPAAGLCYSGRTHLWGRAFNQSHFQEGRVTRKGCSPVPRLQLRQIHLSCCSLTGGAGLGTQATAHPTASSVQGARWLVCPADGQEGPLQNSGLGEATKPRNLEPFPNMSHGM